MKKPHMLRCVQSPRSNVLHMYASARRSSRALPLSLFDQPAGRHVPGEPLQSRRLWHMAIIDDIRDAAQKRLLFLPHAVRQMSRPVRMITPNEVASVVMGAELVENYPEDARGHSCLVLGFGDANRAVHVVCSPKDEYLAIITAYIPDPEQWSEDFRKRR